METQVSTYSAPRRDLWTDDLETPRADAPTCPRCRRLHLLTIPCWRGRYAANLRTQVLATKGRTCWLCGEPGADSVDHRIPRSKGGTDEWGNLYPAHGRCNSERSNTPPPGEAARVVVVTGPPAAGKTTYVRDHAAPGDVVVDLDAIAAALCAIPPGDIHHYPDHIRSIAQRARRSAIAAAYRLLAGPTVWVIHTAPSDGQRALYLGHGATFVHLDPGADVVTQRAADLDRPASARAFIADYYGRGHHTRALGRRGDEYPETDTTSAGEHTPASASARWRQPEETNA